MSKFHINDKGVVGKCSAQPGNCEFGDDFEHFSSPSRAREYYELKNQAQTLTKLSKPKTVKTAKIIPLDTIMDRELLNKMVEEGYVSRSFHKDDDTMQILAYGPKTQYEGKWNNVTKQARGLIIQTSKDDYSDAIILQRPWKKFFTLQQLDSGWHLGDEENEGSGDINVATLDFNAPAEVTDKRDGSLAILYNSPNGDIALSTKGSFHSDQAQMYTKFLKENDKMYETAIKMMKDNPNTTFLYELVGPNNQIVLRYNKTDISFLGAVDKETGKSYSTSDFKDWENAGLDVTDKMPANNLAEALALPNREGKEGMVVRMLSDDPNKQHQIKIKQDDYLKLHRIATHMSVSGMRDNIKNSNLNFNQVMDIAKTGDISQLGEINKELSLLRENNLNDHANEREAIYKEQLIPAAKHYVNIYNNVQNMDNSLFEGKDAMKNLVLNYNGTKEDKGIYITMFRNRFEGKEPDAKQLKKFFDNIANNIKG